MTKSELQELEHIKQLLAKLQELQTSIYMDAHVDMEIGTGGYKHSVSIFVHFRADAESIGTPDRTEHFTLSPWYPSSHNTNICNGCIDFINAHRERKA